MTTLTKPIKRTIPFVAGVNRPLVIEVDPESQRIGFHEKGCKHVYWLRLLTAYALAIRAEKEV